MSRLSRYITGQIVLVAIGGTVILCMLIMLVQSLRLVDLIVNRGLPFSQFLTMTTLMSPRFLAIVVPIAVFAAALFTYNKLISDNEVVVMRSAGLSQWALARPGLLVATVSVAFCFLLNLYLIPVSYRSFRDHYVQARSQVSAGLLKGGQFNTIGDSVTIYVRERIGEHEVVGILIQDNRNPAEQWTILAERGVISEAVEGPRVIVFNGSQQVFREGKLDLIKFDQYIVDVGLEAKDAKTRWRQPQERFLHELFNPGTSESDEYYRGKLIAEGHNRIASALLPLSYVIIGIAAMLGGQFSRRGQLKRLLGSIGLMTTVLIFSLGFHNLAGKVPQFIFAMYANGLLPIFVGTIYLARAGYYRRQARAATAAT